MNHLKRRLFAAKSVVTMFLVFGFLTASTWSAPIARPVAIPVTQSFFFEGRLEEVSGRYDFLFRLFDSPTGGNLVTPATVNFADVLVDSGEYRVRFTNFTAALFNGQARFLEVRFRIHSTNPNAPFTLFNARPQLLPVPYAYHSLTSWNLSGNAGTTPGTNFLGTTDNQSLVMKTNNLERLRIDTAGNVGVGTSGPIAKLEGNTLTSSGIGLLGTSATRGVVGRLGNTSCSGVYAVGGCSNNEHVGVYGAADSGAAVFGTSNSGRGVQGFSGSGIGVIGDSSTRGVVGTLGRTSCAGVYAVGGCTGSTFGAGVYGRSATGVGVLASTDIEGTLFRGESPDGTSRFRVDWAGKVFANGGFQASGADVAEFVPFSDAPGPGDVVEIDRDNPGSFRIATIANSTAVAGVITTRPGVSLSKYDEALTDPAAPQLALVGRVPVKATVENGAIQVGDLLVSSSLPGYAMRAPAHPEAGTIIGKALANLESGTDTIELLVMLR